MKEKRSFTFMIQVNPLGNPRPIHESNLGRVIGGATLATAKRKWKGQNIMKFKQSVFLQLNIFNE